MGELIRLDERRTPRHRTALSARCYVDLSCPYSYLVAERVQRTFGRVSWRLASTAMVERRDLAADADGYRTRAEARARALREPLIWPDGYPRDLPLAMRAAHLAIEQGRGGAFIVAAGRLAFCGGYDLEDPDILAEAAAAAGIGLDACLAAARDPRRDRAMEETGRKLLAVGADCLPVLRVGRTLLWSEERISAYLASGTAATQLAVKP